MEIQISIVIATWNAAKTLKGCLNSIIPQLSSRVELIVIDGGSKDETNQIIDSYGDIISYKVSEPDKGIYDAWNKGVSASSGKWVAFIGADDVLLPGAIDTYLEVIDSMEDIDTYDYICALNEHVDDDGNVLKVIGGDPVWSSYRFGMNAAHVASLHNKRNLFESIGGYDLQFRICADYDLLLRKRNMLKSIFVPVHIARMKVGGMSFSLAAIKETFAIRRKNKSLPLCVNFIVFIINIIAFKFFILRNRVRGRKF